MSKKVTRKIIKEGRHYHIVIEGVDHQVIFLEPEDYQFFLSLFGYLIPKGGDRILIGSDLANYGHDITVVSYCLLPSGCELLVHCTDEATVSRFVDDLMALYTAYFYNKYNQKLLDNYRVEAIDDSDLLIASRNLHTKPPQWRTYEYSSLRAYLYQDGYDWLETGYIADSNRSTLDYLEFLES